MKQILIISGKGGTGKTVVAAAFAALAEKRVTADCDVDAADLHLLMRPEIRERHVFKSGATAFIEKDKCTRCGQCIDVCRFGAVSADFAVDPISCEGCAFCRRVCPESAITMKENVSGEWFFSETPFGPLVHARLGVAEENSGKLVSLVRQKAKELADEKRSDWVLVDGAPGIGCPVIASLAGIDCAVVVTEPSLSALHDAQRVIGLAEHFGVPVKLVINKFDLNLDMAGKIEEYCRQNAVRIIGKIHFDEAVVQATVAGRTVTEFSDAAAAGEIKQVWDRLRREHESNDENVS